MEQTGEGLGWKGDEFKMNPPEPIKSSRLEFSSQSASSAESNTVVSPQPVIPLSSSQVEVRTYSVIPQLNTPEAKEVIRILSEKKIASSIQIKALIVNYDEETGRPLGSTNDRVEYALRYDASDFGDRFSPPGMAENEIRAWAATQESLPEGTNIYREYIKARCRLTDRQADLLLYGKGALHWDFDLNVNPPFDKQADFFRNPLFLTEADEPEIWQYSQGRDVVFANGEIANEYTVMECEGSMVTITEGKGKYTIPKGYLQVVNPYTFMDKIKTGITILKDALGYMVFQAQMTGVMIADTGRIHPFKTPNGWVWVAEPNANITEDPKQEESFNYYGSKNKYYQLFISLKNQGVKVITAEHLKDYGGLPYVNLQGLQLRALDHHRIRGASDAHIPIGIIVTKEYSTFN